MTQVLDRDTFPTVVEAPERPEVREPLPPPRARFGTVRWLAWVVGILGVVVAAVVVFGVVTEESDGSWEIAEFERMVAMAPAAITYDGSFEVNELARMMAMMPETADESWEVAEGIRMGVLAPEIDYSFERNEFARMQRLLPDEG